MSARMDSRMDCRPPLSGFAGLAGPESCSFGGAVGAFGATPAGTPMRAARLMGPIAALRGVTRP